MNKFIKRIIHFSLRHRYFVFFMTGILAIIGFISYKNTAVETFPDVTNTQIIIIAQWPGRSAEEVEKFVTIPLEVALNSVQKKSNLSARPTPRKPPPMPHRIRSRPDHSGRLRISSTS